MEMPFRITTGLGNVLSDEVQRIRKTQCIMLRDVPTREESKLRGFYSFEILRRNDDGSLHQTLNRFCFCRNLNHGLQRNIRQDFIYFTTQRCYYQPWQQKKTSRAKPEKPDTVTIRQLYNTTSEEGGDNAQHQSEFDHVMLLLGEQGEIDIPTTGYEASGDFEMDNRQKLYYRVKCNLFTEHLLQISDLNPDVLMSAPYYVSKECAVGQWDDPCNLLRLLETRVGTINDATVIPPDPYLVHLHVAELDPSSAFPLRRIECSLEYSSSDLALRASVGLRVMMVPNKWNLDDISKFESRPRTFRTTSRNERRHKSKRPHPPIQEYFDRPPPLANSASASVPVPKPPLKPPPEMYKFPGEQTEEHKTLRRRERVASDSDE
jgi:hypothetical protein